MATFTDDFNRADGNLGGNWTTTSGTPQIISQRVGGAAAWSAYDTTVSDSNRIECTCTTLSAPSTNYYAGPSVKCVTGTADRYYCCIRYLSSVYYFLLYKTVNAANYELDREAITGTPGSFNTMSIVWDNGALSATLNGGYALSANDSDNAAGIYAGIFASYTGHYADNVFIVGGSAVQLAVDPSVIGNYGACTDVELTGVNTAWTAGTPGTPTFTVDHGTISAQVVNSATSATVTYCPGDYLGPVVFTDPSTGQTATAMVTSDTETVPPGDQCPFDEDFIATANATVIASNRGLPTLQSVIVPAAHGWSDVYLQEAIADLWYSHFRPEDLPTPPEGADPLSQQLWLILNGGYSVPTSGYTQPSSVPLVQQLESLIALYYEPVSQTYWNLNDLISAIKGLDNRSITQVYDIVAGLQAGSNQDVLDDLAARFGLDAPTIAQLGAMIEGIATVAGYDLGDVLDAIAAIPTTDLTDVTNKLNTIQPNGAYTLSTLAAQLDGVATSLGTINDKLDAIQEAIDNLPTATANPGAPVWPGLANVTLGTVLTLSEQPAVTGPFDGVLIDVTTPPTRTGLRQFGDAPMDYGVGEIAFVTDNGYIEPWQYLGFRTALYTPKMMRQASGVRCRILAGAAGTIRTFTSS